ncbi:MAG: hypothetical protein JSR46_11885, partial [Verrucomicrobia bacterium]|nr:hypothetical protein [Verrucomicrobiota bacterium]
AGNQIVIRNGQEYQLEQSDEGLKIIGKDIKGMMQSKVPNVFIGTEGKNGIVNIVNSSKEVKEAFYNRIPMNYFADAFLASLLLRPQDGKIESLDQSNVLFSAQPNSDGKIDLQDPTCLLRPVLIDLDETMPANNNIFIADDGMECCAVRLGLMGFPHARRALDRGEKEYLLHKIQKIVDEKVSLRSNLESYAKKPKVGDFVKQEHIDAFCEVIERLEGFTKTHALDAEWNLQSLCFAVLPEYARQWTESMAINPEKIPPEALAAVIGKNSFEKIMESMTKRYGT